MISMFIHEEKKKLIDYTFWQIWHWTRCGDFSILALLIVESSSIGNSITTDCITIWEEVDAVSSVFTLDSLVFIVTFLEVEGGSSWSEIGFATRASSSDELLLTTNIRRRLTGGGSLSSSSEM